MSGKAPKDSPYVNRVLLINIKRVREEQVDSVYKFIENIKRIYFADQDVICGLYGDKVKLVNQYIYNLSDKLLR